MAKNWSLEGRRSDPSGPDKAEWKTDECGERGGGWRRGRIYCLLCPTPPPPSPPTPTRTFPPASPSLAAFVPCPADLSNSLLPEDRSEENRRQQRRECSTPSCFLSLRRSSLIPCGVPSFSVAYHVCIILYRTLPINIIRAARST